MNNLISGWVDAMRIVMLAPQQSPDFSFSASEVTVKPSIAALGAFLFCTALIASDAWAAEASTADIKGRYTSALTDREPQWLVDLDLHENGSVTYRLAFRSLGKVDEKLTLSGRWILDGDVLTVDIPVGDPSGKVTYKVVPCLSFDTNAATPCAPGLHPVSSSLGDRYFRPMWNLDSATKPAS